MLCDTVYYGRMPDGEKVVRTKISVSLFRLITEMGGNYNLVKFK